MRKATLAGFALALVFAVSGCGDSLDSVMKDTIKLMKEKAEVLDTIKDKESAEKAKPKLEAINKKIKDLAERTKKLTKDQDEKKTMETLKKASEKFEKEGKEARDRLNDASKKVRANKEAAEVLKGIDLN